MERAPVSLTPLKIRVKPDSAPIYIAAPQPPSALSPPSPLPPPPGQARVTAVERRAWDFQWLKNYAKSSAFFGDESYMAGLFEGYKNTKKKGDILYAATFILAFIIISGGLPSNSSVEIFGSKFGANLISKQMLSAILAGLYAYYTINALNNAMAVGIIRKNYSYLGEPHWPFFTGKYTADLLWTSFLLPRVAGYKSGLIETGTALMIVLVATVATIIQFLAIGFASWSALFSALYYERKIWIVLSGCSFIICTVCMLSLVVYVLAPLQYKFTPLPTHK